MGGPPFFRPGVDLTLTERSFFGGSLLEALLEPILGRLGAHLGALLGPSWALLGPSWGHLGPNLGHVGALLGHLPITEYSSLMCSCSFRRFLKLWSTLLPSWAMCSLSSASVARPGGMREAIK